MPTSASRFHLISGNRLDRLAAHLGEALVRGADPDSLAPDTILIPQPSLRHWLLQTLAERHGIAANLDLITPSEFVWRLLRAAHSELPESSPWDREALRWHLFALLRSESSAALPVAVRAHLQRADAAAGARAELTRFELAEALAGAYDKYQAYRRDWLRAWEAGEDPQDWQAALWRALRRRLPSAHRAALIGDWLARFDRRAPDFAGEAPPGMPARLSAFGTIHVSPDVLHLLAVAGQWCALNFYLPTPSAEYWGDVESLRARLRREGAEALPAMLADAQQDNPLLQAWGAAGREILAQLYSYEIVQPEAETELFVAPGRDTLLHRLQQDVLERRAPEPASADAREALTHSAAVQDASVQVHACHSKLREVEVLHDQLRAMLENELPGGPRFDPPLQPREIAVLAPDIVEYLPLARAVFGGLAADDPRYIPFSLADRPQSQTHPLVGLFLGLFDLADAPFSASAFRDRLAVPAVMRALNFDAAQLAKLDDWFEAVGIRWGEDAAARERAGVGRWSEYSFAFGLERLLGGYAAGAGELRGIDDALIAPYAELEGGDAELLDRLLVAYQRLRDFAAWMRQPRGAADWQKRLSETFLALAGVEAADEAEAQARRRVLETLDRIAGEAADAGPLPAVLLRRVLHDALAQPSPHQPWLAGGVVFAGMVPLRTVPFRVICLLGLDADAYPRRETGNGINRLIDAVQGRAPRRLGDRSVRDDDRFLFLQLLCATGEVFYLSYGGRDARDGSLREPATPIGELLDAIERMRGSAYRERMVVEHPLQPFSARAFGAGDDGGREPRRFSYRDEWRLPEAQAQDEPAFADVDALERDDADVDDTDVDGIRVDNAGAGETQSPDRDELQRFFANPAKTWLRDRLGLRLPEIAAVQPDREPLGESALGRYQAVEALLARETGEAAADSEQSDPMLSDLMLSDPMLSDPVLSDPVLSDPQQAQAWLRAGALLPPGRDGTRMAIDAQAIAVELAARRDALRGGTAPHCVESGVDAAVVFRFCDVHGDVRGGVHGDVGDNLRVIAVAGKLDGKRRLRAGIDHLLLASVLGESARTHLLGYDRDDGGLVERVYAGIGIDAAQVALDALLALWREGLRAPLPFAPKAASAYADALREGRDARAAWQKAREAFAPFQGRGENDDPWLRLAFRPDGLLRDFDGAHAARFREIAERVFAAVPSGAAEGGA